MADISCPECKKIDPARAIDRVEKVSSLVASGTAAGVSSSGLSIGQTALSTSLAPPSEPASPTKRRVSVPPKPTMKAIKVSWDIGIGIRVGAALIVVIAVPLIISSNWVNVSANDPAGAFIIAWYIGGVIGVYILATILENRAKKRQFEQAIQEYERAVKEQERAEQDYDAARTRYDEKQKRYRAAKERWNELYYCHRHDAVFLPNGRSELISRDKIWEAWALLGFP